MATLANLIKNIDPPAPDSVVLATENTTADSIKFGIDQGGKMGYISPGANTVTPFQQDIQADSVVLATENETADSIKFGFDTNGKLGYIAPGADTVTPFKNQEDVDAAYDSGYADGLAAASGGDITAGVTRTKTSASDGTNYYRSYVDDSFSVGTTSLGLLAIAVSGGTNANGDIKTISISTGTITRIGYHQVTTTNTHAASPLDCSATLYVYKIVNADSATVTINYRGGYTAQFYKFD